MTVSSHLPTLKEMFPGQILLDVRDVARCFRVSEGHIYNLSSAKKLPFKLERSVQKGVSVSIVAMANYLDTLLSDSSAQPPDTKEAAKKRKPGRPRNNGGLAMFSFQSALSYEILAIETERRIHEISNLVKSMELDSNEEDCERSFEISKTVLTAQVMSNFVSHKNMADQLRPVFKSSGKNSVK